MPPWFERLVSDHAKLRSLAAGLAKAQPTAARPGHEQLQDLLLFLDQHSKREEDTLFRALAPTLPTGRGPLAVARAEHVALDAVCDRLRLAMAVPADHSDHALAAQTVRHDLPLLLNLLERHLAAEEKGLFPLAAHLP